MISEVFNEGIKIDNPPPRQPDFLTTHWGVTMIGIAIFVVCAMIFFKDDIFENEEKDDFSGIRDEKVTGLQEVVANVMFLVLAFLIILGIVLLAVHPQT